MRIARSERTGDGQLLSRVVPLIAAICVVAVCYDLIVFRGLDDPQSMDNAQLARQIYRHQGFTTLFLRPQALAQVRDFLTSQSVSSGGATDLFPPSRFPPGTPKILPDTYNAPGYPFLLAMYFHLLHPDFDQVPEAISIKHIYTGDRFIPFLNQTFLVLTALLIYALGKRLFDERVAWLSAVAFLGTDIVWQFSLSALSTNFVTFLITAMLMCALEVYCVSERCFENDDRSFTPAWMWGLAVTLLLGLACLTRLHLLVLLVPIFGLFILMPRGSLFLASVTMLAVAAMVTPWFVRETIICGNPLGSNFPLFLSGEGEYTGNQIYCTTSIPSYDPFLHDIGRKEIDGFLWHIQHGWTLLGSNPLVLFFLASLIHVFKRRRARMFHWLLVVAALFLIAANSFGAAQPVDVGPWNILIVLLPCILVMGAAFFFVLLDRMNLQIRLVSGLIVFIVALLGVVPMLIAITKPNTYLYAFPPYMPPLIKSYGQFADTDEWVTTDMPWATAWYADRASLWLPDSIADFQNFNDNLCPTGIMLLTPVTTQQSIMTYGSGEYKEWFPFVAQAYVPNVTLPTNFPLNVHTQTPPGGPDYDLWSDRPRWQEH